MKRGIGVVVAAALILACAACGSSSSLDQGPPLTTQTARQDPAPGIDGEEITYRQAPTDQFGTWSVVEIHGLSAEVPTGARWRTQLVQDPCYGDERYYILVESTATRSRLRVDLVARKVTSQSDKHDDLLGVRDRISRSFSGSQRVPAIVQTFGPHPTQASCTGESDSVPTLIADEFTPPPTTVTPIPTKPGQEPVAPTALEGTEVIER